MPSYLQDQTPVYTAEQVVDMGSNAPNRMKLDTRTGGVKFSFSPPISPLAMAKPGVGDIPAKQYTIVKEENTSTYYIVAMNLFKCGIGTQTQLGDRELVAFSVFKLNSDGTINDAQLNHMMITISGTKYNSFSFERPILGNYHTVPQSYMDTFYSSVNSTKFYIQLRDTTNNNVSKRGELKMTNPIRLATTTNVTNGNTLMTVYKVGNQNLIQATLKPGALPTNAIPLGVQWSLYTAQEDDFQEYFVSGVRNNIFSTAQLYNAKYDDETGVQLDIDIRAPLKLNENYFIDAVIYTATESICITHPPPSTSPSMPSGGLIWNYSVNPIQNALLTQAGGGKVLELSGNLQINPMDDPSNDDEVYPTSVQISVTKNNKCYYKQVVDYTGADRSDAYANAESNDETGLVAPDVFGVNGHVNIAPRLIDLEGWYESGTGPSKNGVATFMSARAAPSMPVVQLDDFKSVVFDIFVLNGTDANHVSESVSIYTDDKLSTIGVYDGTVTRQNGYEVDDDDETTSMYPNKVKLIFDDDADQSQFAGYDVSAAGGIGLVTTLPDKSILVELNNYEERSLSVNIGIYPAVYRPSTNVSVTLSNTILWGEPTSNTIPVRGYINKYVPVKPELKDLHYISNDSAGGAIPKAFINLNNTPFTSPEMKTTVSYKINAYNDSSLSEASLVATSSYDYAPAPSSSVIASNIQSITSGQEVEALGNIGQSFTNTNVCTLDKIKVAVSGASSYLRLRAWSSDTYANAFDGDILAQSNIATNIPTAPLKELSTYLFTTKPVLAENTKYVFEVVNGSANVILPGSYVGGTAYASGNPGLADMLFEVYTNVLYTSVVTVSQPLPVTAGGEQNDGQSFTTTTAGRVNKIKATTDGYGKLVIREWVSDTFATAFTGAVIATSELASDKPTEVHLGMATYIFSSKPFLEANKKYVMQCIVGTPMFRTGEDGYTGGIGLSLSNPTFDKDMRFEVYMQPYTPVASVVTVSQTQGTINLAGNFNDGQSFTTTNWGNVDKIKAVVSGGGKLVLREWVSDTYETAFTGDIISTSELASDIPAYPWLDMSTYVFSTKPFLEENKKYVMQVTNFGTIHYGKDIGYTGGTLLSLANPTLDRDAKFEVYMESIVASVVTVSQPLSIVDIGNLNDGQSFTTTTAGRIDKIKAAVSGGGKLVLREWVSDTFDTAFTGAVIATSDSYTATDVAYGMSTYLFTTKPYLEANKKYVMQSLGGTPYFKFNSNYTGGIGISLSNPTDDKDMQFEVYMEPSVMEPSVAPVAYTISQLLPITNGGQPNDGQSFTTMTAGNVDKIKAVVDFGSGKIVLREWVSDTFDTAFTGDIIATSELASDIPESHTSEMSTYVFSTKPYLEENKKYVMQCLDCAPRFRLHVYDGGVGYTGGKGFSLVNETYDKDMRFEIYINPSSSTVAASNVQSIGGQSFTNTVTSTLDKIKVALTGHDSYVVLREWVSDTYATAFDGAVIATSELASDIPSLWSDMSTYVFTTKPILSPNKKYVFQTYGYSYVCVPGGYAGGMAYENNNPGLVRDMKFEVYTVPVSDLLINQPVLLDNTRYYFQLETTIVEESYAKKTHLIKSDAVSAIYYSRPLLKTVQSTANIFVKRALDNIILDCSKVAYDTPSSDPNGKLTFVLDTLQSIVVNSLPAPTNQVYGFYPNDVGTYNYTWAYSSDMYPNNPSVTNTVDIIPPTPSGYTESNFYSDNTTKAAAPTVTGLPASTATHYYLADIHTESDELVSTYNFWNDTYSTPLSDNTTYYLKLHVSKNGFVSEKADRILSGKYYSRPVLKSIQPTNIYLHKSLDNIRLDLSKVLYDTPYSGPNSTLTYALSTLASITVNASPAPTNQAYTSYPSDVGTYNYTLTVKSTMYPFNPTVTNTVDIVPPTPSSYTVSKFYSGDANTAAPTVTGLPSSTATHYYLADIHTESDELVSTYNFWNNTYTTPLTTDTTYYLKLHVSKNGFVSEKADRILSGKYYTRPTIFATPYYVNELSASNTEAVTTEVLGQWDDSVKLGQSFTNTIAGSISQIRAVVSGTSGNPASTYLVLREWVSDNYANAFDGAVIATSNLASEYPTLYALYSKEVSTYVFQTKPVLLANQKYVFQVLRGTIFVTEPRYSGGKAYVNQALDCDMKFEVYISKQMGDLAMYSSMASQPDPLDNTKMLTPSVDLSQCVSLNGDTGNVTVSSNDSAPFPSVSYSSGQQIVVLTDTMGPKFDIHITVKTDMYGLITTRTFENIPLYTIDKLIRFNIESLNQDYNSNIVDLFNSTFTQYKYRIYHSDIPDITALSYKLNGKDAVSISSPNVNKSVDTIWLDPGTQKQTLSMLATYPNTVLPVTLYQKSQLQVAFPPLIVPSSDPKVGVIYGLSGPITAIALVDDNGQLYSKTSSIFVPISDKHYTYSIPDVTGWILSVTNAVGTTESMNGEFYSSLSKITNYSGPSYLYITGVEFEPTQKRLSLSTSEVLAPFTGLKIRSNTLLEMDAAYASKIVSENQLSTRMVLTVDNNLITETYIPGWIGRYISKQLEDTPYSYETLVAREPDSLPSLSLDAIQMSESRFVPAGFTRSEGEQVSTPSGLVSNSLVSNTTEHYKGSYYKFSKSASVAPQIMNDKSDNIVVKAEFGSNSSLYVSWYTRGIPDTSYIVERSTDGFATKTITELTTMSAVYSSLLLDKGVTYQFRVKGAQSSIVSDAITVQTVPIAPTLSVAARNNYEKDPVLQWTIPQDNTYTLFNQYSLQYSSTNTFTNPTTVTLLDKTHIPNLPIGTHYARVCAFYGSSKTDFSNTVTVTLTALPAPPSLNVTAGATVYDPITVSWSASGEEYGLLEYSNSNVFSNSTTVQVVGTTYSVSLPGQYFFRIRASYSGQLTDLSSTATGTIAAIPAPPILTVQGRNDFEHIVLGWSAPNAVFNTYSLQYSSSIDFSNAVTVPLSVPNYRISSVGTYFIRVAALNAGKSTGFSGIIAKILLDRPFAPTISIPNRSIFDPLTLSWNVPDPLFINYEFEYSTTSNFTSPIMVPLSVPSYLWTLTGTYYFRVRAKYDGVYTKHETISNNPNSNIVSATFEILPAPELNIATRASNYDNVVISWDASTNAEFNKYLLEYSTNSDFSNSTTIKTTNTTYTLKLPIV
jgi:hypothetical protein